MTVELGYFFNDICGTTSNSWAGILFSNILYTSILLALIILLIICFTYPAKKNTPFYITMRLIFYVFVSVIGILAIHHRIIEAKLEDEYSSKMNKEILETVRGGNLSTMLGGTNIKIAPKYKPPVEEHHQPRREHHVECEMDSEEILDHVLKQGNFEMSKEEEPDIIDDHIKVVGSSVEDMLAEIGA